MTDSLLRRVLVVGSGGQVGRALLATAPAHVEVTGYARSTLDITNSHDITAAIRRHRPDLIVNAAAYTAVDAAESDPRAAFAANAYGARTIAAAAGRNGVRLVHLSTDFVFDGLNRSPYPPDAVLTPLSVYGTSKAAGELAVREALPDALIVRTAWIYAAQGRNFVTTMMRLMRDEGPIRVVNDQIGTPTHARSFAAGLWALAATGARGLWHLTDGGSASWHEFATAIAEEALARGLLAQTPRIEPIATADYPTAARRPAYSVLDCTATWRATGRTAQPWRAELGTMLASVSPVSFQEAMVA